MKRTDTRLRPIPGFPDYYVEEELGNIWSFKRYEDGRILKPGGISRLKNGNFRSVSVALLVDGKQISMVVSRLVMNITDSKIEIDHKDRNIWNNKKKNLRKATRSQQLHNTAPRSKTGFKGVHPNKRGFMAQIWPNGRCIHLGTYSNIYEAAAIWNLAACKYHGEFAVYNKVDGRILTL